MLTKPEFQALYAFLGQTLYPNTIPLHDEVLDAAEAIHDGVEGWRPAPLTDPEREALSRDTLAFYDRVRALYPVVVATWTADGWRVETPGAVELARGLTRPIIVEVRNASGDEVTVGDKALPEGGILPRIENLTAGSLDDTSLSITIEAPEPTQVDVPVTVAEPAILTGRALDSATGEPFPARLTIVGSDGVVRHAEEFATNTTLSEKPIPFRPLWVRLPFCYTSGAYRVALPPGRATVTIDRGFESPVVTESVDLAPGGTASLDVATGRAMDMRARGWISGDTHIHWAVNSWDENEDLDLLAMVQRAEDLRVANNLTLYQWRPDDQGGPFTKPDHFPMGRVDHLSGDDYLIWMGEEFRNDNHYGHINLLNLTELITPVATGPGSGGPDGTPDWPQNKAIIEAARAQGGISLEAHSLGPFHASGVAVNVILGYTDGLDQLDPAAYYRFLDVGVRLGLGNGSDHPARVVGCCRTYVYSGTELDYAAWCDGLVAGRTFTTSGPLLFITVNGRGPGEALDLRPGDRVTVRAEVWSRHPIGNLEIVSNAGAVVASVTTEEQSAEIEFETVVDGPAWFTARCGNGPSYDALLERDTAHTSAVFVDVDGRGVIDPRAAQFWVANVKLHRQRFLETANFESDAHREEALAWINRGLAAYEALAGE